VEEETCLPTGRYEKDGIRGLEDRSRTPKNIPHKIKTDDKDVKRAIEIKKRLKTFSVKRLKEMFKLRYSPKFFDIEGFGSMDDFMSKIRTYNIFFNNFRKNSYKDNKSPLEILKETAPETDTKVTLLPPINLDKVLCPYINKRGYHVHDFPS